VNIYEGEIEGAFPEFSWNEDKGETNEKRVSRVKEMMIAHEIFSKPISLRKE